MSGQSSRRDPRNLRPLLPAEGRPVAGEPGPSRSRRPVLTACDSCRRQKTKCSGERPKCRRCVSRHIPCHYVARAGETSSQALSRSFKELQGQGSSHKELVELLRDLPDREAQHILSRLRSGVAVDSILNQVKAGDALLQMAVAPETRLRYEFPYRVEMPQVLVPQNPYLSSMLYEATFLYPTDQRRHHTDDMISGERRNLYLKPFHAARVIDPLLSDARPSAWTNVSGDNMLMRDLLTYFLHHEYQFAAAFQKDLFLQDMTSGSTNFCSSLLVNMVLAYACVCYPPIENRAEYWNPRTLTYRFFAEARRLWDIEAAEPRITTVQTGILFSVFYTLSGLDEVGQPYRIHSVALARKLRLFDVIESEEDERMRQGRAYAAWALFNWETLVGFSFMLSPLLKKPPAWDLPDPSQDASFYGETWAKYPLSEQLLPLCFGHVFRARSEFRVIMNEFCQLAFSEGSTCTIDKANELHLRLQKWYDNLATPLLPTMIVLPGHLQLHIYYHHLVLTMYEPLLDIQTDQTPSPKQIVADAEKYLQTVVRLYYLRHGFEAMDLFVVIPLVLLAYRCLDSISEQTPPCELETLRSTLILAAKGLSSQGRNHYLARALYSVIRGRMRPQEVGLLRDSLNPEEFETGEKPEARQTVRSRWPVSVVKKKQEMDSHILGNLVGRYGELNIEQTGNEQGYSIGGSNVASRSGG